MKIGSIVIACYEFDKMLSFWQQAFHYVPGSPAENGWVILCDPKGQMPNISLDQIPKKDSEDGVIYNS
jgi:hypothetical protein